MGSSRGKVLLLIDVHIIIIIINYGLIAWSVGARPASQRCVWPLLGMQCDETSIPPKDDLETQKLAAGRAV